MIDAHQVERQLGAEVDGEAFLPPLIPPGLYVVHSLRAETREMFEGRRRVLMLDCEVVGAGQLDGTRLTWYASLPHQGRPPAASKFMRAWVLVNGRPRRDRRPAYRDLVAKRFRAVVATVTHSWERDHEKKPVPLPPTLQYSVIRTLVDQA